MGANTLTPAQRDQIRTWIRSGYTTMQIVGLAKNQGFTISPKTIDSHYKHQVREEFQKHMEKHELSGSWFNKEYRAERAAEMAELLFGQIMDGKMFAEEVTEKDIVGGTQRTTKPVYFAGMIKNWTDLVNLIGNELGQRNKQVDLTYNKNQNLNISFLIDKIFDEDDKVNQQIEGAEIIDVPSESDFGDEEGFLDIVDDQTDDDMKLLLESGEEDESAIF